jgi:endonuclease/exonuclease/phosphatase family metal-dependent hydrolase
MKVPIYALPLRILTHNIRYATTSPFPGEELWPVRRPRLICELQFHTRNLPNSFICLQEVLHHQLTDIHSTLNHTARPHASGKDNDDEWAYVGVGRDDGHTRGEYAPIFYRPSVFALQSFRTVWLSETPEVPSKGWDAASTRIVTIGVFKHIESKTELVLMNTHLDDQGTKSREHSAKIILALVGEYAVCDGTARQVFVAGDFNSEPGQEAYDIVTAMTSGMVDVRHCVGKEQRYGHEKTFTGFSPRDGPSTRIDFLFCQDQKRSGPAIGVKGALTVEGFGVLENKFDDGVAVSDHRAVTADFQLCFG